MPEGVSTTERVIMPEGLNTKERVVSKESIKVRNELDDGKASSQQNE